MFVLKISSKNFEQKAVADKRHTGIRTINVHLQSYAVKSQITVREKNLRQESVGLIGESNIRRNIFTWSISFKVHMKFI